MFKHDPLDYDTRTHHTSMDTYEHLIPDDLHQAAVVVATMLYNTAMREEMLPRPARQQCGIVCPGTSLRAQCDDWIDTHRAACWDYRRTDGNHDQ